ncbi:MAG TPA: SDR family oxidoreductase [Fibrobacteria bacterium]|nr:SDR family oxidoreductase [Fibrobacteria bacterium]
MGSAFSELKDALVREPKAWLVTGAAGFIGSHLLEHLLRLGQSVTGLDSFATGHRHNLEGVRKLVGEAAWSRFRFIEGDVRDPEACRAAVAGVQYVLHQAALGSVPRSIVDPLTTHAVNVDGTLNVLIAARDAKVKRMVYASSSSVYGDEPDLPKREDRVGKPLSPYALTKWINELYAGIFHRSYGLETAGLRYFNVFGARQDPEGQYAAVIPKWTAALIKGRPVRVNGKGEISRDFCYVDNVVQANLLAATAPGAAGQAFNVALNDRVDLNRLYEHLRTRLLPHFPHLKDARPEYGPYREGDIMHSQADISLARSLLGYAPTHTVAQGLDAAMDWYRANVGGDALI